jgi:hypothetical protein
VLLSEFQSPDTKLDPGPITLPVPVFLIKLLGKSGVQTITIKKSSTEVCPQCMGDSEKGRLPEMASQRGHCFTWEKTSPPRAEMKASDTVRHRGQSHIAKRQEDGKRQDGTEDDERQSDEGHISKGPVSQPT